MSADLYAIALCFSVAALIYVVCELLALCKNDIHIEVKKDVH